MKKMLNFTIFFLIPILLTLLLIKVDFNGKEKFHRVTNDDEFVGSFLHVDSVVDKHPEIVASVKREWLSNKKEDNASAFVQIKSYTTFLETKEFTLYLDQMNDVLFFGGSSVLFNEPQNMRVSFPVVNALGAENGVFYLYSDEKQKMVGQYCK